MPQSSASTSAAPVPVAVAARLCASLLIRLILTRAVLHMSPSLPPNIAKLTPRLASQYDGEVVATARAIERTLKTAGLDWHDLVSRIGLPRTEQKARQKTERKKTESVNWRDDVRFCADNINRLRGRVSDISACEREIAS